MEYIEISEIEWPQGTKLSIKALVRAAIAARIESKAPKNAAAALAKPPVESTMQHVLFRDKSTPCTQQGRTAQSEYLNALGEQLTEAMSTCFENKKLFKFEHVDIGAELEKRGLLNIWPSEVL